MAKASAWAASAIIAQSSQGSASLAKFLLKSPIAVAVCSVGSTFSAVIVHTLIADILAKGVSPQFQKNGVKGFSRGDTVLFVRQTASGGSLIFFLSVGQA